MRAAVIFLLALFSAVRCQLWKPIVPLNNNSVLDSGAISSLANVDNQRLFLGLSGTAGAGGLAVFNGVNLTSDAMLAGASVNSISFSPFARLLWVGGLFTSPASDNLVALHVDTQAYVGAGQGLDGPVDALSIHSNGTVWFGGDFTSSLGIQGVPMNRVGQWNGTAYNALGGGINSTGAILDMAVLQEHLYVCGASLSVTVFSSSNSSNSSSSSSSVITGSFLRWSIASGTWHVLETSPPGVSALLATLDNALLYTQGALLRVLQPLSGSNSSLGPLLPSGGASCISVAPNERPLVCSGDSVVTLSDAGAWEALGAAFSGPLASLSMFQGALYAAGSFQGGWRRIPGAQGVFPFSAPPVIDSPLHFNGTLAFTESVYVLSSGSVVVDGDASFSEATVVFEWGAPSILVSGNASIIGGSNLTVNFGVPPASNTSVPVLRADRITGAFLVVRATAPIRKCEHMRVSLEQTQLLLSVSAWVDASQCGLSSGALFGILVGAILVLALLVAVPLILKERRETDEARVELSAM